MLSSDDDDDDDRLSIATTALHDLALEIQEYMLDPHAKPWSPLNPRALSWHPTEPVITMNSLVMDNPHIFYPWVGTLDPALVFALRTPIALRRRFHGISFRVGSRIVQSRYVRASLQLTKIRMRKYESSPACIDKLIERGPLDIYDTWYSMSSEERQIIATFFSRLGVSWIDTHLP